jgi:hypothetical protein
LAWCAWSPAGIKSRAKNVSCLRFFQLRKGPFLNKKCLKNLKNHPRKASPGISSRPASRLEAIFK